ncbi:PSD1 and planctomycete cytochrome C domain-containing protein [Pleomorphovibrio marinus]|uniref:PSD1 and planctomycete cytochrome C domain-containing protein n=1 Tax=Pleomorphovibrio marinus TaxID=2164132 RepID=UPI000E0B4D32|nr:PSD1 and planctomycete cytochrome C domain-containing protein [Pleomorphovibrio marinus]
MKKFSLWLLCFAALLIACNQGGKKKTEFLPETVSYNLHIRPILSENCFACHGPDANKREAGLRLDLEEEAFKPLKESKGEYALVKGKPKQSQALGRIKSEDPNEIMPPPSSHLQLTDHEIGLIEKWIRQGAEYEPHWAFVPPEKTALPKIKNTEWPATPLDHFVLAKQEVEGLSPNKPADKNALLRRLSFDITGLPPSLGHIDRFLEDDAEDAYERVLDELLDSPAYGEKMAVNWMDLARYADSHGYQDDYYRTQWPWRDWVIHAFNKNLPYDQFVTWQLAGDLLPDTDKEKLLATGFNRNHKITEESGAIDEEYRVSYVVDRTNVLGKAFLGVTLECAQCHDHKYDPISQEEYFQIYAFFNNVAEHGIEESTPGFSRKSPAKYPLMEITDEDIGGILSFVNRPDSLSMAAALIGDVGSGANYDALMSEIGHLRVSVMGDADSLRTTYLLERGDYETYGKEVTLGTPKSIMEFGSNLPKNRLGLAKWLFDPKNPLTARVIVNRIWMDIFGEGIVDTPGDFGMQGALPSHPELLDWLAVDFMENGWDIKYLLKQIFMSATYRQSSIVNEKSQAKDPDNIYLSRFPRNRLSAEQIRDLVLSSSGLLEPQIGGPSVKPYQPEGLWEAATSGRGNLSNYKQDTGQSLYRRGLYNFIKRTVPPPSMILFDASNRDQCEVERESTNTPLQALYMMNAPEVLEASRVLSGRLLKELADEKEQVSTAFRLIVGRKMDEVEWRHLENYYREQKSYHTQHLPQASQLLEVGEYPKEKGLEVPQWAALMQVIQAIYNLEETIMKS